MSKRKLSQVDDLQEQRAKHFKDAISNKASTAGPLFGIIDSINLRNFMCHTNLTMRFDGNVNFIIGNNGSGKSAVLTALIVGLGGKTASTSRGNSMKNLIKTGYNHAIIKTTLRNSGDDAINPDKFGRVIIVERRISLEGASSYKLKSADNKLISTKREDVMNVLDELNLQVDNPLTCLNQELSKNFLHSKSESDKYKFFLKTTQLEQLSKDYQFIKDQKGMVEQAIRQKEFAMPALQQTVEEKEDAYRNLATLKELRVRVGNLKNELAWSHVNQLEQDLKPIQKELEREKNRSKTYGDTCTKAESKLKKAQDELALRKAEVARLTDDLNSTLPERTATEKVYDGDKTRYRALVSEHNKLKRHEVEVRRELVALTTRIKDLKNNEDTENRAFEEYNHKKKELEGLYKTKEEIQTQLESVNKELGDKSSIVIKLRDKADRSQRDYQEIQSKVSHTKNTIRNLTSGKQNKLKLYGHKMPELISKIEQAYGNRSFKEMPRGPIGKYLSIRDANLAVPVECAVRNLLSSFIVDNHADEKVLERLRNSTMAHHERSRFSIYTVKFTNSRYDVNRNKAQHPKFSTVLDLLNIEDPVVANCLIDMCSIESLLVIPETEEAVKVMQGPNCPRNCSRAFTKIGDEVYPDRFYSNRNDPIAKYLGANVEDEIKRLNESLQKFESQKAECSQQVLDARNEVQTYQQEIRAYQTKKNGLQQKLNKVNIQVRKLEMLEAPVTMDWKDLEDEVANAEVIIEKLVVQVEEKSVEVTEAKKQMDISRKNFEVKDVEVKSKKDEANASYEKANEVQNVVKKLEYEKSHFEQGKKKQMATVSKLQKQVEEQLASIEVQSNKATVICAERIKTRRPPKHIENEIDQVNQKINKEEKVHGKRDLIIREAMEAKAKFDKISSQLAWSKDFHKKIEHYIASREIAFQRLQRLMGLQCIIDFDLLLRQRNFIGKILFDHKKQVISIIVKPKDQINSNTSNNDLRSLSGGERSFSTVCFILSLWQVMQSPLRCLDEFDVFMDMANRRVAMEMMVDMAMTQNNVQFIFLTPHDISALPNSSRIHVWRMADPKRGREGGDQDDKPAISDTQ